MLHNHSGILSKKQRSQAVCNCYSRASPGNTSRWGCRCG